MIPSKSCRQAPCLLHRGRAAFPAEKMACLSTFVYLFNFQLSLSTWFIVSHRTPLPKFNRQVCLVSCSYFGFIFFVRKVFVCHMMIHKRAWDGSKHYTKGRTFSRWKARCWWWNKMNEEQKDESRKTFFLQEPHFMSGSATQKISTWESLSLADTGSGLRSCFCTVPCLNPLYWNMPHSYHQAILQLHFPLTTDTGMRLPVSLLPVRVCCVEAAAIANLKVWRQ